MFLQGCDGPCSRAFQNWNAISYHPHLFQILKVEGPKFKANESNSSDGCGTSSCSCKSTGSNVSVSEKQQHREASLNNNSHEESKMGCCGGGGGCGDSDACYGAGNNFVMSSSTVDSQGDIIDVARECFQAVSSVLSADVARNLVQSPFAWAGSSMASSLSEVIDVEISPPIDEVSDLADFI